MTKQDAYDWAKKVLNTEYFTFDDTNLKITPKNKLNWKQIDGLKCIVFTMLGGDPDVDFETDEDYAKFKMDARYLPIDKSTIKEDLDGNLYVDVSELTNQDDIVAALLKNEDFVAKITASFDQEEITMNAIKNDILTDPLFIGSLKDILEQVPTGAEGLITDEEEATVIARVK